MEEYGFLPTHKNKVTGLEKEEIFLISAEERDRALKEAHYNLFLLKPKKVFIDFLTDSGTGAISPRQWIAADKASNDYASNAAMEMFVESVRTCTGKDIVLPVHQGRAAEHKLAWQFIKPGSVVLSNHLFDTTRANFEMQGALCIDIPAPISSASHKDVRFRGNIDLEKLEWYLKSEFRDTIACIITTLTDNTGGGQPATLENIRAASALASRYNILFIIDGSRIAQNAYVIWRDEVHRLIGIADIIREIFSYCDIGYMSLKKNGAHMGGCIVTNSPDTLEKKKAFVSCPDWLEELANKITITEGLVIGYGGISGQDLAKAAIGLEETVREPHLEARIGQAAYLQTELEKIGIPIKDDNLPGGHAVYVDVGRLIHRIPNEQFPAHALVVALYKAGGIRSCSTGSLMFEGAAQEILRLAIPAGVYEKEHFDYVVRVFKKVLEEIHTLKGFRITQGPKFLRHFTCHLEPIKC